MTKRLFYLLFRDSWKEAFIADRIQYAFEKASIWPLDLERTIGPLRYLALELASPKPILARTPLTSRTTRRVHKEYKRAPTQKGLALIFHGHEELAAKDSINQHIIKGLQQSLKLEKKKRKPGKRLNLIGEEDYGPQFFTPERVRAAIDYQAQKEDDQELEKRARIENKARKALEKQEKELQKQLAREARLEKRTKAQSEKLEKAAQRKAQLEAKRASQAIDKARKTASKASNRTNIGPIGKRKLVDSVDSVESAPVAKRVVATNSRGRPVITPARYV